MRAWMRTMAAVGMLAALTEAKGFQYWDPADTTKVPKLISQTGLYANLAAGKTLIPEAVYFEVNSPLWSDGSKKKRWVLLKPGTSIGFREADDYWDYPDGAVFVKEFDIDTVPGDTLSRVLWETRFLILKKEAPDPGAPAKLSDMWYGFSYKWRKDQKEADLVEDEGLKAAIRTWPDGLRAAPVMKKWVFPSRGSCLNCHRTEQSDDLHGRSVLGFFTAQLNRPSPIASGVNQLEDLFTRKILSGARPAGFAKSPRWVGIDEKDPGDAKDYYAAVERKARSYIAANCSGCHGKRGMELGATFGVDLNFDYHSGTPAMKLEYKPVSWNFGLDTLVPMAENEREEKLWGVYVVTPRFPQKSVALFRQRSRNTSPPDDITGYDPDRNQMPPMGSFEVNTAAMKVIEEWIRLIPSRDPVGLAALMARQARTLPDPVFHEGTLKLPPELLAGNPVVALYGLDGREVGLRRLGRGEFAVPASTPRGVYVLRVGARKYTRSLW